MQDLEAWYKKIVQQIQEATNSSIRDTGSEPNDPFWRAREAQNLGEAKAAYEEAWNQRNERGWANYANYQAQDRAADTERWAIERQALAAQWKPSEMMSESSGAPAGIQISGAGSPAIPTSPVTMSSVGDTPPEYGLNPWGYKGNPARPYQAPDNPYKSPPGGKFTTSFNALQFQNPDYENQRERNALIQKQLAESMYQPNKTDYVNKSLPWYSDYLSKLSRRIRQ